MPVTVGANKLSVVHAASNGVSVAFPDVCKTPAPPAPPIPIPYPNIAKSSDTAKGAKKVTCDGNPVCVKDSNFMMSTGDEGGSLMGIASNKFKGKAEFVNFSFDVQVEGKNVPRAFDLMLHNDKNTPPVPVMQPPVVAVGGGSSKQECGMCGESKGTRSSGGGDGGGAGGASLPMAVPSGAHGASGGGGAGGAGGGAAGAAKPAGATPASAPAVAATSSETTSRVVSVDWDSSHLWCSDRARFTGTISGDVGAATMPAKIQPVGGGNPHQAEAKVSGGGFSGNWLIKDVLPPIQGGHPAKEQPFDVTVGGVKAPVPLKVRFAPTASKKNYDQNRHHFSIAVQDYKITVGSEIRYVKGWAGQVVKLGESAPEGTGGLLDGDFYLPGYRWLKRDEDDGAMKFWDGADWRPLPPGFVLADRNNFCVGFYEHGGRFVCQYGATWPEMFTNWNLADPAKQRKIQQWVDTIDTTWTGKFDFRRRDCKSGDSACCRYRIVMKASFELKQTFESGLLVIADGNIRSNDQLFFIGEPRLAMAAHEVGHHIGNPDEYKGARLDTSLNDDGAHDGLDDNSIMGQNLTTVKKRHFRLLCKFFTEVIASEYGRTFDFEPTRA